MSSLGKKIATKNQTTFRPKQDMMNGSMAQSSRTITRPTQRYNNRPAKAPKHNTRNSPKSSYRRYLARLLRKMNSTSTEPNLTISSNAMHCMSNFVTDIFGKIAHEAGKLAKKDKKKTLSEWDIKSAVTMLMPNNLGKHANSMASSKLHYMKNDKTVSKTADKTVSKTADRTAYNKDNMVYDPETGCYCPK